MPPTTEETVRRAFEASAEDYESVLAFIHPDFVMVTPVGQAAEPDTYRGPDGVRRWFETFYEVMDEVAVTPVSIERTGPEEAVAVEVEIIARGRASGLETNQRAFGVCRAKEGKLVSIEFHDSLDEARAAASK